MTEDARKIKLIMELRRQGISDPLVLSAMERVPRDLFVPDSFADQAFDDHALPIACGQTISQPFVVAFMTQALRVGDRMKVLEIGTGSGYQSAVLAQLCRRLYTIERYRTLSRAAVNRFESLGITNITTMVGDGMNGWPEQAPFDRIIVTAASQDVPANLLEQLKIGGIMVAPVGQSTASQMLIRYVKSEEGFDQEEILPVRFVPLVEGIAREL